MRSHADIAAPEKETERALCSASGDAVVASPEPARRARPICGTPLTGRQRSACSPRHRAALSGRQRVPLPAAERGRSTQVPHRHWRPFGRRKRP